MSNIEYSFWQKLFHRIVLGSRIVSEFSLDLEIGRTKVDIPVIEKTKHVFITGLARSGTTILMRRFYNTGSFASLTYRDMPFVLMPLFWKRLSGKSQKNMKKTERAHSDGLMVDYDSPEAFEEVFWKTTSGHEYIRKDRLLPHNPDEETLKKFKHYVGLILKSREHASGKYLSKNNNNILRLRSLCAALPHSVFLVPFRTPLQHAWSLLRQHRRFLIPNDPFTTKYIDWLGHNEFGANHRPFCFSSSENTYAPEILPYWMYLWNDIYRWLLKYSPDRVIFVSYDVLCSDDNQTWTRLMELAEVKGENDALEPLRLREHDIHVPIPKLLLQACNKTHKLLLDRHMAVFSR
ncbi:MAG: sulfotransferase [Nitrospinaceae bacterium]|jgi:hypothetical protein|nr:sulfotransferase [Nitrospinaceae bacterium]